MVDKSNRLINEKSPYLLQHAYNPVDWYPWGKEAFEDAKKFDKPIFLSIGYATCHWCHVMEKESFANPKVAKELNDTFICIKVDREELPEIDGLYMEFAQVLMSSGGGWPLNVVLTTDLKPFYAVTYLPPDNSQGMMGLRETAMHIKELWSSQDRSQIQQQASEMVSLFEDSIVIQGDELIDVVQIRQAVQILLSLADTAYGGLKGSYKFPLSFQLDYLLKYGAIFDDNRPVFYAELTFEMMQRGGIYDHIGGGFSRYSVDDKWQIPHFEKMLYDNAILAKSYLDAFVFFKKPHYKEVVIATLDYLIREMKQDRGGFYTAQDADCGGKEGYFYTWKVDEIKKILEKDEQSLFLEFYNITNDGNFEGRNVLYTSDSLEEFAEAKHIDPLSLKQQLETSRKALFEVRNKREKPFTDDKVITSWNGLVVEALLRAGEILQKEEYTKAAVQTLEFIENSLVVNKKLLRRYRDREARFDANLEDYASLIKALITAFEMGLGVIYLRQAIKYTKILETEFKSEDGAFYFSHENHDSLLLRKCEFNDGSEPSGNSVHAENLLRLFQITQNSEYLSQAEDIFKAAMALFTQQPQSCTNLMSSLLRYWDKKAILLVAVIDEDMTLENELRDFLRNNYTPHLTVVWKFQSSEEQLLLELPHLSEKTRIDGQSAIYLCTREKCLPPVLKIDDLKKEISSL
ncbi:MAG: hypothetical protein S4CHLAM37_06870 [Chlamydiia bacterium]|nr:hypothetical protein [Chlamydiia bacterium]